MQLQADSKGSSGRRHVTGKHFLYVQRVLARHCGHLQAPSHPEVTPQRVTLHLMMPPQGSRGRSQKRGGGRTGAGSRKRPAKAAAAGADLIGKRILVLQTQDGSDPEWHICTVEDWQGVRSSKARPCVAGAQYTVACMVQSTLHTIVFQHLVIGP